MKFGLVSALCKNKDISFNVKQIMKYIKVAKQKQCDFIFFGESFLQGFDSLNWDYSNDSQVAVSQEHESISRIIKSAKDNEVGVGFGYFELSMQNIYSSYLVINKDGSPLVNYRRMSKGWKHFRHTNHQYKEGNSVDKFVIGDKSFTIALCGDLWDGDTFNLFDVDKVNESILLWPVHVNFSVKQWEEELEFYKNQSLKYTNMTFMINNIMEQNTHGGAHVFTQDSASSIPFNKEDILIIEI